MFYRAFVLLLLGAAHFSYAETGKNDVVWVSEIRGSINPASADFLKSSIRKAEDSKAQALVVELDTPGGLVSSVRSMTQAIDSAKVPVVVFVTPAGASATSAGALLMLSAHVSAMSPGTNIGAAHPVGQSGKEIEGAMGEKAVNDVAAYARGLAELRGRNVEVAERVVTKSLSMTAEEALKKKFIDLIANTRAELFQKLEGQEVKINGQGETIRTEGAVVRTNEMTTGQLILHYLANPNVAAILMTLAMLLIYVEVSHPGITIAGILGGICLIVGFIALQILPIHAGGVLLVVLGALLIFLELFVPTGGILAGGGVLSFVLGLIWMVDTNQTDMRIIPEVWIPITLGLASGVGIVIFALAHGRKLSEQTLASIGGGGLSGLAGYEGTVQSVIGAGGSGKILIRGEIWDYKAQDDLKVGDHATVVSVEKTVAIIKKSDR